MGSVRPAVIKVAWKTPESAVKKPVLGQHPPPPRVLRLKGDHRDTLSVLGTAKGHACKGSSRVGQKVSHQGPGIQAGSGLPYMLILCVSHFGNGKMMLSLGFTGM